MTSRRDGLAAVGGRVLREAEGLLGHPTPESPTSSSLAATAARIDVVSADVVERLRHESEAGGPVVARLAAVLVELQGLRSTIRDVLINERIERLDALEAGLVPLRRIQDPEELLERVSEAVVRSCGFDRAMLSRVRDSTWRPWKGYASADVHSRRLFDTWMRSSDDIPLDHLLLESEMVRRRGPTIVTDPRSDPRVYRPMVEASGFRPYVAAPLMPTGRVIGFLHADYEHETVDELDKDILGAFAEAFGQLFERAVLFTRLREQRERVARAMDTVEQALEDLASAEIELSGAEPDGAVVGAPRLARAPAPGPHFTSLLTPREHEVLALVATGATNSRIADLLVITDGTVKSHVKQILRKLRAANRAEAIVRYLQMTSENAPAMSARPSA